MPFDIANKLPDPEDFHKLRKWAADNEEVFTNIRKVADGAIRMSQENQRLAAVIEEKDNEIARYMTSIQRDLERHALLADAPEKVLPPKSLPAPAVFESSSFKYSDGAD